MLSAAIEAFWLYWWWSVTSALPARAALAMCFGTAYGLSLVGGWGFYHYFSTLPGKFAFKYLFGEPTDFLNIATSSLYLPLMIGLILCIIAASLLFYFGGKGAYSSWKSFALLLAATAILGKNLKFNADSFLPVTSTAHGFVQALYDQVTANNTWFRLEKRVYSLLPSAKKTQINRNGILIINESLRSDSVIIPPDISKNLYQFSQAYSNATVTITSVPLILSGRSALEGADFLHRQPLIYEWLSHHSQNLEVGILSSHSYEVGNMKIFFESPQLNHFSYRETLNAPSFNNVGADDRYVVEEFKNFLTRRNTQTPFFIILHFNGTHYPYQVPKNYQRDAKTEREKYDNAVLYLRDNISSVWQLLMQHHLLDDTFILSTSDHGESFGEDATFGHFGPPSPANAKINLWAYIPSNLIRSEMRHNIEENQAKLVTNQDLFPTITDLFTIPRKGDVVGSSLFDSPEHRAKVGFIYNFVEAPKSISYLGAVTDTSFSVFAAKGSTCHHQDHRVAKDVLETELRRFIKELPQQLTPCLEALKSQ